MNKFIKEQLQKCKVAQVPYFDENTLKMFIQKSSSCKNIEPKVNHSYIVEIHPSLLNNKNSVLVSNWNGGYEIVDRYLKISFTNNISNMFQFKGNGYDIDNNKPLQSTYEFMWLPKEGFRILREV